MKLKNDIVGIFLAGLLTVFLLESGARIYLLISSRMPKEGFGAEYSNGMRKFSAQETYRKWAVEPHPYFGFVGNDDQTNNFGFHTKVELPVSKNANEFIIGIFGGSVAERWGKSVSDNIDFSKALKAAVPSLRDKKIVIVNFGLGAWKQPQQFIAYAFFSDSLDMSINLDGYNEIAATPAPWFPVEYPLNTSLLFYPDVDTDRDLDRLRRLVIERRAISEIASAPGLRSSAFVFLIWKGFMNWSQSRGDAITLHVEKSDLSRHRVDFFYKDNLTQLEIVRKGARVWEKYVGMQSALAAAEGKRAFFFLQPNLRVPGSKPLTTAESARIDLDSNDALPEGYQELSREIERMKKRGIAVFDLSYAFRDHREELYVDGCCHFNDIGNRIISEKVVSAIADRIKGQADR